MANVIALLMLYGHILELVEVWIGLLGVLLSTLSGIILVDFFIVTPLLEKKSHSSMNIESINWAGVITILSSVILAHYVLTDIIVIEVITAGLIVIMLYPLLRLTVFSPIEK